MLRRYISGYDEEVAQRKAVCRLALAPRGRRPSAGDASDLPREDQSNGARFKVILKFATCRLPCLQGRPVFTTANDRWLLIAESQGWARRVPGILDDPAQFRVELTPTGQRGVLPALTCHCCDECIFADVTWLPLVAASGSVTMHPVHETCGLRVIRAASSPSDTTTPAKPALIHHSRHPVLIR